LRSESTSPWVGGGAAPSAALMGTVIVVAGDTGCGILCRIAVSAKETWVVRQTPFARDAERTEKSGADEAVGNVWSAMQIAPRTGIFGRSCYLWPRDPVQGA
jgi:hypothetical protein